jgi:hypothetical protein
MSFSHDKFLKPITSKDRYIQILDDNGVTKHLINPFSIINVMVSNNLLRINLRENKFISILFNSINESKLALVNIQIQIEQLTTKVPLGAPMSIPLCGPDILPFTVLSAIILLVTLPLTG